MTLRRRVLSIIAAVVVLAIAAGALALSYTAPCKDPEPLLGHAQRMTAIVYRCYGAPDVIKLEEVAKPVPADDQLLVKVHAAALNPLDWHRTRGSPYILRLDAGLGAPKDVRLGQDFAGTVEAVGKNVARFKPGDAVFGGRRGAFAEYVVVPEDGSVALIPSNVTFEQASAVNVAAITALQALRDRARVRPGQKVLINGASGGVGTFAVQIAKYLGAEVTGVCSTRNVELVRSLGADHVIDYTKEDFTRGQRQYDVIIDNVGNHSPFAHRRVLKPEGILVIVGGGGPAVDPWIGAFKQPIKAFLLSHFVDQQLGMFVASSNQKDLEFLAELIRERKLTPAVDRRYMLSEIQAAMEYLESGRARGKVVVNVRQEHAS